MLNKQTAINFLIQKVLTMTKSKNKLAGITCLVKFKKNKIEISNLELAKSFKSTFSKHDYYQDLISNKGFRIFISAHNLIPFEWDINTMFTDAQFMEDLSLQLGRRYSSKKYISIIDVDNSFELLSRKIRKSLKLKSSSTF